MDRPEAERFSDDDEKGLDRQPQGEPSLEPSPEASQSEGKRDEFGRPGELHWKDPRPDQQASLRRFIHDTKTVIKRPEHRRQALKVEVLRDEEPVIMAPPVVKPTKGLDSSLP